MKRCLPALAVACMLTVATAARADEPKPKAPPKPDIAAATTSGAPQPSTAPVQGSIAPPAPAAPETHDELTLKSGAFYTGRLTEIVPGNHVVIAVAGGTSKRIAWSDIDKATHNGKPLELDVAHPDAKPKREPGSMVFVQLDADDSVVLEQQVPEGEKNAFEWVEVCHAPCNLMLPNNRSYRANGDGVRKSGAFALSGRDGERVTIAVDAAHSGGFVGGVILTGLGIPTMLVGGLVWLVGAGLDKPSVASGGLIATGVGTAVTLGGIVLIATNSSTSQTQTTLPAPQGAQPKATPGDDKPETQPKARHFFENPERRREAALYGTPPTLSVASFSF